MMQFVSFFFFFFFFCFSLLNATCKWLVISILAANKPDLPTMAFEWFQSRRMVFLSFGVCFMLPSFQTPCLPRPWYCDDQRPVLFSLPACVYNQLTGVVVAWVLTSHINSMIPIRLLSLQKLLHQSYNQAQRSCCVFQQRHTTNRVLPFIIKRPPRLEPSK